MPWDYAHFDWSIVTQKLCHDFVCLDRDLVTGPSCAVESLIEHLADRYELTLLEAQDVLVEWLETHWAHLGAA